MHVCICVRVCVQLFDIQIRDANPSAINHIWMVWACVCSLILHHASWYHPYSSMRCSWLGWAVVRWMCTSVSACVGVSVWMCVCIYIGINILSCYRVHRTRDGFRFGPPVLGSLLLVDGFLRRQRVLLARLRRLQLLGVEVLDAVDQVQRLLLGLDGCRIEIGFREWKSRN